MKVIVKNSNLIFQRKHQKQIVYKNYWVRGRGQYIDLDGFSSIISMPYNNVKIEASFYVGLASFSGINDIIASRSSNCEIALMNGALVMRNLSYSGSSYSEPLTIGDYSVSMDNKTGAFTVNGVQHSVTPPASSTLNHLWIYAGGTHAPTGNTYFAGLSKWGRVKIYNATTNALLLDIRPALVDGVPCLYEAVSDTELYSEDETALVLE